MRIAVELRPDQEQLVADLHAMSVGEVALARGIDRTTVRVRVRIIAATIEAAGGDGSGVLSLIRRPRRRMIPLSGLRGADRAAAAAVFGETELAPTICSVSRIRRSFARRMRGPGFGLRGPGE